MGLFFSQAPPPLLRKPPDDWTIPFLIFVFLLLAKVGPLPPVTRLLSIFILLPPPPNPSRAGHCLVLTPEASGDSHSPPALSEHHAAARLCSFFPPPSPFFPLIEPRFRSSTEEVKAKRPVALIWSAITTVYISELSPLFFFPCLLAPRHRALLFANHPSSPHPKDHPFCSSPLWSILPFSFLVAPLVNFSR